VLWSFTMTHNSDIWFTTDGRIGREKYWSIILITILWIVFFFLLVVGFAGSIIGALFLGQEGVISIGVIIISCFQLALLWQFLSYGAQRCHDLGKSGFYQLIPFYVLFMLFQAGDVGDNEYGPNPDKGSA